MKVTVIPIVIGALGTVTKSLIKGLGDLGKKILLGLATIISTGHTEKRQSRTLENKCEEKQLCGYFK